MPAIREQLNLYLSKPMADDLHLLILLCERTHFVEEVLTHEQRYRKLKAAIAVSSGTSKDEIFPDVLPGADIDRWIEESRA